MTTKSSAKRWAWHLSDAAHNGFLCLFVVVFFAVFWGGCCTGFIVEKCSKCDIERRVLEKRSELSKNGSTYTVYCRTQLKYRRNPFTKNEVSEEKEKTYVIPLNAPEKHAKRYTLTLIPSASRDFHLEVEHFGTENLNTHEWTQFRNVINYNKLNLPVLKSFLVDWNYNGTIHILPEDVSVFSRPFTFIDPRHHPTTRLAIPYKLKDNICHYYVASEEITQDLMISYSIQTSLTGNLWRMVLIPPVLAFDIVTSPIQLVVGGVVFFNYITHWDI